MAVRGQKNQTVPIIIGKCPLLLKAINLINKAASFPDIGVLIQGETGTGKELLAQEYHKSSGRTGLLVAVNCAAIAPSILESQLFGHERGAFTGAEKRQIGFLEQADGGTLFLDEIGEMPLDVQRALLRAMETRSIRRVGGTQTIPIDIRVIAATNRDLKAMVTARTFRQDLYYRICDITVRVPPLRQRGTDALLIARAYLEELMGRGYPKKTLSNEAVKFIREYPWPGNVRELKMALRTQYVHCPGDVISEKTLKVSLDLDVRTKTKMNGDNRRRSIVDLLREMGPLKSTEIRRVLSTPTTTLFHDLTRLVAERAITKLNRPGGIFFVSTQVPLPSARNVHPIFPVGTTRERSDNLDAIGSKPIRPSSSPRIDGTTVYEMILRYVSENQSSTAAALEQLSRSSRSHVTRCLNLLIADGYVVRLGKGKNTRYVLAETGMSPDKSGENRSIQTGQVGQPTGQVNRPKSSKNPKQRPAAEAPKTGQAASEQTGQVSEANAANEQPTDIHRKKQSTKVVVLTTQHQALVDFIREEPRTLRALMLFMKKRHRETFIKNWVMPLREAGLIEMTIPKKPNSPRQKYQSVPT